MDSYLEEAIVNFNKKFNTESPFEWVEKIEKLERLVDSVKVCKPINWLGLDEDKFEVWLHRGSNHIISPVQAWEQNHEKISKYFPDFEKADLPIQMAFIRCFFFYVNWLCANQSNFTQDYAYNTHSELDRTLGSLPFFHYMDGEDIRKTSLSRLFFIRRIFKGRAKGGLAAGFFQSVQYLNGMLNNKTRDEFLFYWVYDGKEVPPFRVPRIFKIEIETIKKINDELFDSYHFSQNPYNKKLINDVLLQADEWLPVCRYLHEQSYDRFRRAAGLTGIGSLMRAKKELVQELEQTDDQILSKYDERMVNLKNAIQESKKRNDCF